MDKDAEWVSPIIAWRVARAQYQLQDGCEREDGAYSGAIAILRRLIAGSLRARTKNYLGADGESTTNEWKPVPLSWWADFDRSGEARKRVDWTVGDFFYLPGRVIGVNGEMVHGRALSVEFEIAGLPFADLVQASLFPPNSSSNDEARRRSGGRPPATWWADFAEELAVYIHNEGVPDEVRGTGQTAVIDAIFERLANAGKQEPSRSSIQSVVTAVLQRLRSAGN